MKKAILILSLSFLPMLMFCQADKTNYIYLNGGVYHLNPNYRLGNLNIEQSGERLPFISNEIGFKIERDYQYFCWGYGFAIIQNRLKGVFPFLWREEWTTTLAYLSVPVYVGLKTKNFKYKVGLGIDYFLYEYQNYTYFELSNEILTGRDANIYNHFIPKCIAFIEKEIPLSFHFEAEISYTFTLAEKHKFGVSSSFKMFEIVSLYGRNYSLEDSFTKSYYYPISLSLSVAYYLPK